jgi:hypothetical protein
MKINEKNLETDIVSLAEISLNFSNWLAFFKSKWRLFILSSLIGIILAIGYYFYEKPLYIAELSFALEENKSSGGGGGIGSALASSIGIDISGGGGGAFSSVNLSELMKSRLIIEKVLLSPIDLNGKKSTLLNYYIELNKFREKWSKNSSIRNIEFPSTLERAKFSFQHDSLLKYFYKDLANKSNLDIKQKDKKITILSIQVKNTNEQFAKFFCEKLAKETSNFYIETKSRKAKSNVIVLQRQVDSVRNQLNTAISGVANEVDNVYNLNPAFNKKVTPSKQRQIDVQTNTAIITNLVVQLELAKITLQNETPLIQIIDNPILPLEKEKLNLSTLIFIGFISTFILTILVLVIYRLYF